MDTEEALSLAEPATEREGLSLARIVLAMPRVFVPMFAMLFLAFALLYAVSAMIEFVRPILDNGDIVRGLQRVCARVSWRCRYTSSPGSSTRNTTPENRMMPCGTFTAA